MLIVQFTDKDTSTMLLYLQLHTQLIVVPIVVW